MLIGQKFTISTHVGTTIAHEHNIRDKRITDKEAHIDPNGKHEIWLSSYTEREAYHMLFDKAVDEYNAKQKRSDRKIDDYYQKIKKSKEKNSSYEMIISVGNMENRIPEELSYEILKEFVEGWGEKNPNMIIYGCYYHADEQGVPHAHIDYIPIGTNFERGMKVQTSLSRALEQMGYISESKNETALTKWTRSENARLEEICNNHGIEIEHPRNGEEHKEKELYILDKKLENAETEIQQKKQIIENLEKDQSDITTEIENLKSDKNKAKAELDKIAPTLKTIKADFDREIENVESVIPMPNTFESASKYRERIIPVINKAIKRIMDKARSIHRAAIAEFEENKKLKDINKNQKSEIESLRNENTSLKNTLSVFYAIRNYFGKNKIDEMYEEVNKAKREKQIELEKKKSAQKKSRGYER